jgi:hypothetical protein
MDFGSIFNEFLQISKFFTEEDLFSIIKFVIILVSFRIINLFTDDFFEAEDNEFFIKIWFALGSLVEHSGSFFHLVESFH